MEAAHDTGLGHRSGEGAEGSEALRERGLSQGLRDQNQNLGGYLLFEGNT